MFHCSNNMVWFSIDVVRKNMNICWKHELHEIHACISGMPCSVIVYEVCYHDVSRAGSHDIAIQFSGLHQLLQFFKVLSQLLQLLQ